MSIIGRSPLDSSGWVAVVRKILLHPVITYLPADAILFGFAVRIVLFLFFVVDYRVALKRAICACPVAGSTMMTSERGTAERT
jgi:hypothetical protein